MTDSIKDNNIFHFIINLEEDDDKIVSTVNTPNKHTKEIADKIIGDVDSMRHFISIVNNHFVSVWSEVLPIDMMEKFQENGIFNGISITQNIFSSTNILCIGLTQPDEQPITKCLDFYKNIIGKIDIILDQMKGLMDKEESTTH